MGPIRLFPLAAAFLLAAPALAGDIIVNAQGKPLGNTKSAIPPGQSDFDGSVYEVTDETLDGVTYQIPDVPQPQTIPASAVKAVYHDPNNVPDDLARGRALGERGDFAGAREALARVAKDPEARPWAKAEAAFRAAESYLGEGKADEAEKQLAAFKAAFPKSKWVTTATSRRANALMALERIDDAKTEYASLKKLPGVPEDVAIESDFYLVWIDEQVATRRNDQAGLGNAVKAYEALVAKLAGKSQYVGLSQRAAVGRASCLVKLGRAAEAKEILEKLVGETKDPRVLASAYNVLGTATWRAAATDKAQQKAALFHYLRVVALYGEVQGADEDVAEAMFHAGELFKELKDTNPTEYPGRARREWNDVIARFPGSEWARRAKEALVSR